MTKQKYTVLYPDGLPNAVYSSQSAARKYLNSEAAAYTDFLSVLREQVDLKSIPGFRGNPLSGEHLANSFGRLIDALDNPERFAQIQMPQSGTAVPPPSTSLEGQLIQGLTINQRTEEALNVYLWFAAMHKVVAPRKDHNIGFRVENGQKLVTAAIASEALPFRAQTSQRLAGAMRNAEIQGDALNEEVEAAQQINADHQKELNECRNTISARAKRIESIFQKRERRHRRLISDQIAEFELDCHKAHKQFETLFDSIGLKGRQQQDNFTTEFNQIKELFYSHLRLRAPVKLWESRALYHAKNARLSLIAFCGITAFAVLVAALIPWAYGDYISQSFVTVLCDAADPSDCTREFSAKGPLTVAGLLLVMSLVLWVIRLQYRIYLSERHLSLDADEKRAFSEAYLAMTEGTSVNSDNEAIVFAALFRPTQDGIIKDDDSSVDLSAAAILAKQLSRGH